MQNARNARNPHSPRVDFVRSRELNKNNSEPVRTLKEGFIETIGGDREFALEKPRCEKRFLRLEVHFLPHIFPVAGTHRAGLERRHRRCTLPRIQDLQTRLERGSKWNRKTARMKASLRRGRERSTRP